MRGLSAVSAATWAAIVPSKPRARPRRSGQCWRVGPSIWVGLPVACGCLPPRIRTGACGPTITRTCCRYSAGEPVSAKPLCREHAMTIHGSCDPAFEGVRAEFERNFRERGEVGASVCVLVEGRTVVDLWGGVAERTSGRPWERDTIGLVWSCTKGATALCAHVLLDRRLLDLDPPVSRYWPEVAQQDKGDVTVRMVLSHQAGLPALRDLIKPGGQLDWEYMTGRLAAEAPFWPPGTRQGYHA